jgi:hypothetical protein
LHPMRYRLGMTIGQAFDMATVMSDVSSVAP